MSEFDRKTWRVTVDELPHYLRHWLDHSSELGENQRSFVKLTVLAFCEILGREKDFENGEGDKFWTLKKIKDGLKKSCQEEGSEGYDFRNFPDASFDSAAKMVVLELADMGLLHDRLKMPVWPGSISEKTKLGLKCDNGVRGQIYNYSVLLTQVSSMPMPVRK